MRPLVHYGWQAEVTQPGNGGASFGRYVEPLPPLEVPNLMRAFLVKANKIDVGQKKISSEAAASYSGEDQQA